MADEKKIDVWMPIYVGDYLKDTGGLSIAEHGAYFKLMMTYWQKGCLEHCLEQCIRIAGAYNQAERDAVANVIRKFFVVDGEVLRNKRLDEELEKARSRKDTANARAKKAAEARWHPANQATKTDATSIATSNQQALLEECPSPSPSPISNYTESTTPERAVDQGCALAEVIAMYHEQLPMLPRVKIVSPKRKALLKTRQRDYPKAKDTEWWQAFFERAAESKFLTGNAGGNWLADFDFLLSPKGFTGVIEGKYQ